MKLDIRKLNESQKPNANFQEMFFVAKKNILERLEKRDVASLTCVSRQLRLDCGDDDIWAKFVAKKFDISPELMIGIPKQFVSFAQMESRRAAHNEKVRQICNEASLFKLLFGSLPCGKPSFLVSNTDTAMDLLFAKHFGKYTFFVKEEKRNSSFERTPMPPHKLLGLALSEFEWQNLHRVKAKLFSSPINDWMAKEADAYTNNYLPIYRNYIKAYRDTRPSYAKMLLNETWQCVRHHPGGTALLLSGAAGVPLMIVGTPILAGVGFCGTAIFLSVLTDEPTDPRNPLGGMVRDMRICVRRMKNRNHLYKWSYELQVEKCARLAGAELRLRLA